MPAEIAAVTAKLNADTSGLDSGLDGSVGKLDGLEEQVKSTEAALAELGDGGVEAMEALNDSLTEMAEGFTLAALAANGIEKALELVKDLAAELVNNAAAAQMVGVQFQNAFGLSSSEVGEWAEKTGSALGRSQDDMEKLVTSAKTMVDGLGAGSSQAEDMAESLAKMATQMSIANGIPLGQAMQALDAGLHGAGRGLYEYGIAINANTQNAEALKEGLGDTYSALTQAQQLQVNYNLVMAGAAKVASDAANATGTYANQVEALHSSWEEMTAHLGSAAMPALTEIVSTINGLVKDFDALSNNTKGWIAALAMGPVGEATKALKGLYDQAKEVMGLSSGGGGADPNAASASAALKAQYAVGEAAAAQIQAEEAADEKRKAFNLEADKEEAEGDQQREQDAEKAAAARAAVVAKAQATLGSAQHEMDTQHAAEVQAAAQAQIKAAQEAFQFGHSTAMEAEKLADDQLSAAEKRFNDARANGSPTDVASAKAAMDAAAAQVQATIAAATVFDQQHLQNLQTELVQQRGEVQAAIDAQSDANDRLSADRLQLQTDLNASASKAQLEADEAQVKMDEQGATAAAEAYKKALASGSSIQDALYAAQKDLDADHVKAWKDGADYAAMVQKAADEDHKKVMEAWASLASSAASGLGGSGLGSVVSGAASMKAAGPAGMAAGAGLALLSQSQGGKDTAAAVSALLQQVADAVGQLLEPLVPVIQEVSKALGPLIQALGELFGAAGGALAESLQSLMPIVSLLANLLADIISPLAQFLQECAPLIQIVADLTVVALAPLMAMLAPFMAELLALGKILNWAAGGITDVVNAIATVWNDVVGVVQSVLDDIADILPGAHTGDGLKSFASSLDGFKISTDGATQATQSMTTSATAFSQAVDQFTQNIQSAYDADAAATQKKDALDAALAAAKANPNSSASDIAALQKAADDADQAKKQADDANALAVAQKALNDAFNASDPASIQNALAALQAAYAQQALDSAANTASTDANTQVTAALNASLTNVPAMFKAAQVMNQVLSGQWNGGGDGLISNGKGSAQSVIDSKIQQVLQAGAGAVTVNGNITIVADGADVDDIFAAVQKKVQRANFTRTGSSPRDRVSRFTLTGQG